MFVTLCSSQLSHLSWKSWVTGAKEGLNFRLWRGHGSLEMHGPVIIFNNSVKIFLKRTLSTVLWREKAWWCWIQSRSWFHYVNGLGHASSIQPVWHSFSNIQFIIWPLWYHFCQICQLHILTWKMSLSLSFYFRADLIQLLWGGSKVRMQLKTFNFPSQDFTLRSYNFLLVMFSLKNSVHCWMPGPGVGEIKLSSARTDISSCQFQNSALLFNKGKKIVFF